MNMTEKEKRMVSKILEKITALEANSHNVICGAEKIESVLLGAQPQPDREAREIPDGLLKEVLVRLTVVNEIIYDTIQSHRNVLNEIEQETK